MEAEQNGRNDITVDGKKFSGNSFLTKGDIKLHNGTILIDTSSSEMEKYLTVSAEKMKSKGVNSVRSRVVNLKQLDKSLTTGKMAMLLLRSFGDIFDLPVQLIREDELDCEKIFEIEREVFQNDEFRFGKNPSFENSLKKRFDWGEIEICFSSEKGFDKGRTRIGQYIYISRLVVFHYIILYFIDNDTMISLIIANVINYCLKELFSTKNKQG